jgi:type III secretion protein Q
VIKVYYRFAKATIKTTLSMHETNSAHSRLPFAVPQRDGDTLAARSWVKFILKEDLRLHALEAALGVSAKLRCASPTQEHEEAEAGPFFALRIGDDRKRAVLHLPQGTASFLSRRALGLDHSRPYSLSPVELGGLMFALDRLAADVTHALEQAAIITGPLCDAEQARQYVRSERLCRLCFCLELGATPFALSLCLNAPLTAAPNPPISPAPAWVASLPVLLTLEVGASAIDASSLRELEKGDFLTLDSLHHPQRCLPGSKARLHAGRFSLPIEWRSACALRIAPRPWTLSPEVAMNEKQAETSQPKAHELIERHPVAALASDLPVDVRVECGQLELTVAEASRLRPGDVLRLRAPLSGEVSLTAGGRRIGRGQLVEVDGELAVELVEIESSSGG